MTTTTERGMAPSTAPLRREPEHQLESAAPAAPKKDQASS